MSVFDDAPGMNDLPPSPAYPIDRLVAPPAPPPADAGGGGLNVPVAPPAQTGGAGGMGAYLPQILGALAPPQPGGFSAPRFASALGAGLSSAGQNWNKPGAAAFASGAGAALQGGQQYDNQLQSAKLKALQTAIAAFRAGDIAGYHQALTNYRAAGAPPRSSAAPAPRTPPPASAPPNNSPPQASVTGSASGPTIYGSPGPAPGTPAAASGKNAAALSGADVIAQARDAIARGAPVAAVHQRLRESYGIDPSIV